MSAYARIRRLATHPAFARRTGCLRCPVCGDDFERVPEYDRHYLTHEPSKDEAWRWLSARSFERWVGAFGPETAAPQGQAPRFTVASRRRQSARALGRVDFTNEELLAHLRASVDFHGLGRTSAKLYDDYRKANPGAPTRSVIMHRFGGTWNGAVAVAGLPISSHPGRAHGSGRFPRDVSLAAVRACAAHIGQTPSYAEYERFQKDRPDAPCGTLVRRQFGGWIPALDAAGLTDLVRESEEESAMTQYSAVKAIDRNIVQIRSRIETLEAEIEERKAHLVALEAAKTALRPVTDNAEPADPKAP